MNENDLDLLANYLSGDLNAADSAALEERLRNEPRLAEELMLLAREDVVFNEWAKGVGAEAPASAKPSTRRMRPVRRKSQRVQPQSRGWVFAAAASIALICGLIFLNSRKQPVETVVARIRHGNSAAMLVRNDSNVPAVDGTAIRPGDELRVAASVSVTIVYIDGTQIEFGSQTAATFEPLQRKSAGKNILLSKGIMSADVVKQPSGKPLVIATPFAEATVIGTQLKITVEAKTDRLEVIEGSVRFAKPAESPVIVNGGEFAIASADADLRVQKLQVAARHVVSEKLIPENGCLWGATVAVHAPDTSYQQAVESLENKVGRKMAVVHQYHAFSDSGGEKEFPTAYEKAWSDGGRQIMLSWKPRIGNNALTWADVAAGKYDSEYVDPAARKLATFGKKIFLTLHHQPDDDVRPAGSGMTAEDYVAMWHHVRSRFDAAGASNVVWVWTVVAGTDDPRIWDKLYPGDKYVDWLACGAYNYQPAKWRTLTEATQHFREWCARTFKGNRAKPIMFNAIGCVESTSPAPTKENWFRNLPAELKAMPDVKAVIYWNSKADGARLYAIDTSQGSLSGFKAAGLDPYLNPNQ